LIRIDPRSYELAVAQRKKQLKQLDAQCSRLEQEKKNLQTSLKIGRDELELAKAEWQRFKALAKREVAAQTTLDQAEQKYLASRNRVQEIENQIALIDPSADQVKAQRELVEVQLKEALLDLDRTRIKAPYSGRVLEKGIEKGQFVTAGSFLGRIFRASAMEVEVHVSFRDLRWLGDSVWSANDTASNSKGFVSGKAVAARVIFDSAGKLSTWDGRLARIKAEVDEKTRTLPLVIEVPLERASKHPSSSYPLTPGMFVTVELMGVKIDRAYLLPRSAVHSGDVVYVAEDGRLGVRSVEVIRRLNNSVYVGEGLKDGDLVIVTRISAPKEGMKVKVRQKSA
jgi:RND family efflux transporter MFP subunit